MQRGYRSSRQRLHRANQINQGHAVVVGNTFASSLNSGQNWQPLLNNPIHPGALHHSNQPVLLQRLLGPSSTQNLLQLTRAAIQPRLVYSSNDYQLFTTGNWNDNAQIGSELNDSSMLNSIATAITRWTEESKVLDGDSMHDCVAYLKPQIIAVWEKHRDEEMVERKEKRKELIERDRKNEQARLQAEKEKQQQTSTKISTETNQTISSDPVSSENNQESQQLSSNIETSNNQEIAEQRQESTSDQTNVTATESERMEVVTTQQTSTSATSADEAINEATSSTSVQNDLIEMTCSETISTEQEMEVNTTNSNNETTEPTTVEVSNDQQPTRSNEENANNSNEQQESSASGTTTNADQPRNSGLGQLIIFN